MVQRLLITPAESDNIDAELDDKVRTEAIIQVGNEGMRIDQELYRKPKHEQFEYVIQHSDTIKQVHESSGIE